MAHLDHGAPWTPELVAELILMVRVEKLSNWVIAERTRRGVTAVYSAISRFAVRAEGDEVRERKCMPCQRPFLSLHAGNRICGMCMKNLQLECA